MNSVLNLPDRRDFATCLIDPSASYPAILLPSVSLTCSMELSVIDITEEVRVCRHCQKKWADDSAANRGLWQTVEARSTGALVLICPRCVDHYNEKKTHGESISVVDSILLSDALIETSGGGTLPTRSTSQRLPVRKLVADSQRGIGACQIKKT